MDMHRSIIRLRSSQPSFPYECRLIAIALLAIACLARSDRLQAAEDIAGRIQAAREHFVPVTDKQVTTAKSELKQRMSDVRAVCERVQRQWQKWLKYLQWDDLKKAFAAEGTPPLAPLAPPTNN